MMKNRKPPPPEAPPARRITDWRSKKDIFWMTSDKKLFRRVKILQWIHRILGLTSYVDLTMKVSSERKISLAYRADGLFKEAEIEAGLTEQLALELIKKNLVKFSRSVEGADFIHGIETYRGQITVIL